MGNTDCVYRTDSLDVNILSLHSFFTGMTLLGTPSSNNEALLDILSTAS